MFETGKKGNAAKKAYEIAYAIFRVAAKMEESGVKKQIESQALALLVSANAEEYGNAAKATAAIDALVKFAIDLNLISIPNGDILLREISAMNEALVECLDRGDDVDVSKFFGSTEKQASIVVPRHSELREESLEILRGAQDDKGESGNFHSGNPAIVLKSGNRQIAILDRIRKSGNCKLKEIQEVLPDCSERTLRYDLEELIERNLVERIGVGGPAVSYKIRQISSVPAESGIRQTA